MLLDDNVVANGEAKPSSFSGRFRCKERVEHPFFHFRWNTGAVVADPDFHAVAKATRRGGKGWFIAIVTGLCFSLYRCIKAIGNQIEQDPCDVLWKDIGLAGVGVQRSFQSNVKALFLSSRPMPGEIEGLLDEGIDVDDPVFTRAFARVQQHVFDDGIGALTMLDDLVEVALQGIGNLADLCSQLAVEVRPGQRLPQIINQFNRDAREIIDEMSGFLISCAMPAVS
jgi:hypothetical protein